MNSIKKILIIGGNAAGCAAAAKARRVNPFAEIQILESGQFISTGTCEIPYVISGEIESSDKLIFNTPASFKSGKNIDVLLNHKAESIDRKQKLVNARNLIDNSLNQFKYDSLILATGSVPVILPQFPENLTNVFYLKSVQELKRFESFNKIFEVKKIAVIGSGYIGLEFADVFSQKGTEVTIFEKETRLMPNSEKQFSSLIEDILKKNNVSFYTSVHNFVVSRTDNKINHIKFEGRILEYDAYLITAGFKPNSDLAQNAGLDIGSNGAVKVDTKLKTSDHFIYAAGDNIQVINAVNNRPFYSPSAVLAHNFGHIAGANAAGGNMTAKPIVRNLSVKIFDKFYSQVGMTSDEALLSNLHFQTVSETMLNKISLMKSSTEVFGKILFEKDTKRILGASFLGGEEISGFADLIAHFIRLKLSADLLSEIDYNYTPPLSPLKNILSVLGRKIKKNNFS
jgi:NADPH-dependent 2,4-dienoyl-CoA reductase/sulfur reductase-like enzyme